MSDPRSLRRPAEAVKPIASHDPLWFKDAVIYQLHVRAFFDANGDGIGDFPGLTEKLDYIQSLGVTAIWLLPFFYSPLRDAGYDIADYTRLHPDYGSLRDFELFLREAHRRELRVITEMVMNHTSDQHEWFQKSRRARAGDKWRDFYVWSDTDQRYREARVIFQDFETSNWTWDPVGQAYFWHRFYRHQPDLNFANPDVHDAMLKAIEFWLDMGVDGMRLDAVPYLYEQEGTNCENLPETHAFLKKLRRHVDERYADKMLLAEANQWPEDAAAYFGDGDQCHMNFHFPLMPRLFMAIEREDRFPIIDILEQTPHIPDNCQWGIFLRNHDELTLEMVTDEERDYMYRVYADDPRARVNLGIRRRLAPLLRDNHRKMELMNALLLSLPGTPILYYGDEVRMGDNIFLGDRDGVRTPMQWNDDRNAGFSRANPQQLYLPVVIDPLFHYSSRNVEVEQSRPHSMLWWMRRILGLRNQHAAFGRGTIEFLTPDNPKVLAFLRQRDDETLLVVANLSRYAQSAELDLSRYRGQTPVELFGQTHFPPIGELPYFLTLGAHSFYWFHLHWGGDESEPLDAELPSTRMDGPWDALFEGKPLARLEAALPAFLTRCRWFAGQTRTIRQVRVQDVLTVHDVPPAKPKKKLAAQPHSSGLPATRMLIVRVEYVDDDPDDYLVPVVFAQGEQEANILGDRPGAGILKVTRSGDDEGATLCDTTHESDFWLLLFDTIARGRTIAGRHGDVEPLYTQAFSRLYGSQPSDGDAAITGLLHGAAGRRPAALEISIQHGPQRHTSAMLSNRLILKMFRQIGEGENPELEISRYLTEQTRLACVPQLAGALEYRSHDGRQITLAVMHEYVANEGDAWTYTVDELERSLERIESELSGAPPDEALPTGRSLIELADRFPPASAQEVIGSYLQSAELLGTRTAEFHLALAAGADEGFAPEPFTKLYQRSLYQSLREKARRVLRLLEKRLATLPDTVAEQADRLLRNEQELIARLRVVAEQRITAQRTRCHGDFHLGQVLFTGKDFVIVDFEGEAERPIGQRRIKSSPLRDVASMLGSFHAASYAAITGPQHEALPPSAGTEAVAPWLMVWYVWSAASYLRAYLAEASRGGFLPEHRDELDTLLVAYLLESAIDKLTDQINHHPDGARPPLEQILLLLQLD